MGFRRKTYGMVRPVKPAKPLPIKKPSILEYKKLLSAMKKQQLWRTVELLVCCTHWWHSAVPYIQAQFKGQMPLESSKAYLSAIENFSKARTSKTDKDKILYYTLAINGFQKYAVQHITVPAIKPYVDASKAFTKAKIAINSNLDARFDSLTTLLTQALDLDITLKVTESLKDFTTGNLIDNKYDQAAKTLYYERNSINSLKKLLWREGLLAVVIHELPTLARSMSYISGSSLVDEKKLALSQMYLMSNLLAYCKHNPQAPNRLVKPQWKKVAKASLKDKILAEAEEATV